MRHEVAIGMAGEFLASYELSKAGVQPVMVDFYGPDIWYRTPEGLIRTVEVKSSSSPYTPKDRNQSYYLFTINKRESDLFAFVALDIDQVVFKKPEEIHATTRFRLSTDEFLPENSEASLELINPMKEAA